MRITIDTEKDSRDDILAAMDLLKKLIGEEKIDTEKQIYEEQKNAEEILNAIAKPKKESTPVEGVPKPVKEAYELADELETY